MMLRHYIWQVEDEQWIESEVMMRKRGDFAATAFDEGLVREIPQHLLDQLVAGMQAETA